MGFKTGIVFGVLMCLGWQNRVQIYKTYSRLHVNMTWEASK